MNRAGFTLLEMLVVLAIIAILAGLGFSGYLRWRAANTVLQGAQEFATQINRTRLSAKKTGTCWQIKVSADTQYQVKKFTENNCASGTAESTTSFSMPAGTKIARGTGTNDISFYSPHGTTDVGQTRYDVTWASNSTIKREVYITSVLGRVIVK